MQRPDFRHLVYLNNLVSNLTTVNLDEQEGFRISVANSLREIEHWIFYLREKIGDTEK